MRAIDIISKYKSNEVTQWWLSLWPFDESPCICSQINVKNVTSWGLARYAYKSHKKPSTIDVIDPGFAFSKLEQIGSWASIYTPMVSGAVPNEAAQANIW